MRLGSIDRGWPRLVLQALVYLTGACGQQPSPGGDVAIGQRVDRVIYGDDDRLDYYDVTEIWQRRLVERSVAVLVESEVVRFSGDQVTLDTQAYDYVCPGERFYGQPEPGYCSATLIDRQLLMTAGHCMDRCDDTRFLFRFYYRQEGILQALTVDDVYQCAQILAHSDSSRGDYGIIKLDRPVAGHLGPAPLRTSTERLQLGTGVTVIGFPMGLPAKVAAGAWVTSSGSGPTFEANTDTYEANSGSGVFTDDGVVVGIHVDGLDDFHSEGGCDVSDWHPDSAGNEGQTYAHKAFEALCDAGVSSGPVCNQIECGDGLCSLGEACQADCGDDLPDWLCEIEFLNDGTTCHCNCGFFDPDCADPLAPIIGCGPEEICGATATCVSPEQGDDAPSDDTSLLPGCRVSGSGWGIGWAWLAALFIRKRMIANGFFMEKRK